MFEFSYTCHMTHFRIHVIFLLPDMALKSVWDSKYFHRGQVGTYLFDDIFANGKFH